MWSPWCGGATVTFDAVRARAQPHPVGGQDSRRASISAMACTLPDWSEIACLIERRSVLSMIPALSNTLLGTLSGEAEYQRKRLG